MIHRPDRVNSDLDDRLIKPNEARSATNLRMGASLNDTNLGITLVNGLKQLPYGAPIGDIKVIGTREDFETGFGYFALWNSNGNHEIWRTDGIITERVISTVGFTPDMDVSIAIVDGKMYWTDNVNQPRMCNIAKGIANLYPFPYQEWFFTQIKRQPLFPLSHNGNVFSRNEASVNVGNIFKVQVPYQFSYYYVFDNNEESRIGPWSNVTWQTENLGIFLTNQYEITRLRDINVVKQIVFVYRIGNDGVVYELSRLDNDLSIYTYFPSFNQYWIFQSFPSLLFFSKTAVSSNITNARFDSVPLLAATNEVAQNRINLGNYLIDYDNWAGKLSFNNLQFFENDPFDNALAGNQKTFKPGGVYNIGIELLDEWGRTIGVVSQRQITAPNYRNWLYFQGTPLKTQVETQNIINNAGIFNTNGFGSGTLGRGKLIVLSFTISGTLPPWAASYRVVRSNCLNVTDFINTNVKMYHWFQKDGVDYSLGERRSSDNGFTFRGAVLEMSSGEPILADSSGDWYVRLIGQFGVTNPSFSVSGNNAGYYNNDIPPEWGKDYVIKKQVNNKLYIESQLPICGTSYGWERLAFTGVNPPTAGLVQQSYFEVEIGRKSKSVSEFYYQTENNYIVIDNTTKNLYGDCYATVYKRVNVGENQDFSPLGGNTPTPFKENTYTITGVAVAKNPTDNFFQSWDSDIGQANVVNLNQRQTRLQNQFIFSDPLVQGTQINGLSKFNSVDNRQTPLENGPITALFTANARQGSPGVLLAIGRLGISSFYVGATQLTNVDGSSNVASTTDYAVSQNPLLGQFGASKIRNICKTPLGTLYWWSEIVNDWIRYSQAGLDRLGATNSFMNDLRKNLAGNPSVFTTYDQVTNEAILIGQGEQAFVFSEQFNTLQPKRDYYDQNAITPERGMSLAQKNIFFLNGILYVMGPNEAVADNSFFGSLKDPSLTIVSNVEPTSLKRWNSYNIFGPKPVITQLNSGGGEIPPVQSEIRQGWWIDRKNNYTAAIRMDENSVGGILNGKVMESRILITNFTFNPTDFDKLNYIEVKATRSPTQ